MVEMPRRKFVRTNKGDSSVILLKAPDEEEADRRRRESIRVTKSKDILQKMSKKDVKENDSSTEELQISRKTTEQSILTKHATLENQIANAIETTESVDSNSYWHEPSTSGKVVASQESVPSVTSEAVQKSSQSGVPDHPQVKPEDRQQGSRTQKDKPEPSASDYQKPQPQQKPTANEMGSAKCDAVPDLYTKVLGPTADEIILQGLNAIWDLTAKFRSRNGGGEGGVNNSPNQNIPSSPSTQSARRRQFSNTSQTSAAHVSSGHQTDVKMNNSGIQADTTPQITSISQAQQTELQTAPKEIQNELLVDPESKCFKTIFTMTSEQEIRKCVCHQVQTMGKRYKSTCGCQTELVQVGCKICKCCKCKFKARPGILKETALEETEPKPFKRTSTTYVQDHECVYNKPDEVKYALVRITKFDEFRTYEILKSTKKKPRKISDHVEGTFVLREKKIEDDNIPEKENDVHPL